MTLSVAYQIFYTDQGSQGILGTASQQQLDSAFGEEGSSKSVKLDDAVAKMIKIGKAQPGAGIPKGYSGGNDSR